MDSQLCASGRLGEIGGAQWPETGDANPWTRRETPDIVGFSKYSNNVFQKAENRAMFPSP